MLSLLLITPIIGSIFLLLVTDNEKAKKIALATSLINLIISIFLWVQFDSSTSQYQFVYSFKELSYCHLNIGVDGISIYFVLLTTFITPVALLSNYNNININNSTVGLKYFLVSFLLLETLQIALFVVLDLFLFYVFFESVLPVLFIVIILYGSGEAKIRSALLLFLYTLAGSLFMLLAILEISNYVGSTDFQLISLSEISLDSQKYLWLAFFLAFAIKTPLWPMTGWLYRAHADSPLAGSIILAGTILKLATYGYLRVLINFLPDATNYFSPLVQTIALITIVYASLATIVQQDDKALIAYSSICHMGVVILGLFSNTIQGIEGAILLAIAHGFVSPALFICVGGVIYERTGVRLIGYIRGLVTYMPVFTILFFIFTLCNTGIPLSLNFLGEQMSLIGIWDRSPVVAIIGATGIVFSAAYSIFLYNRLSYGSYSPYLKPLKDINRREFMLLISLLIPKHIINSKEDLKDFSTKNLHLFKDVIDFKDYFLYSIPNTKFVVSNVAVALFVTAYARIIMSDYFNNDNYDVFYTDTDSIFTDKPLPAQLVDDKKLGLMKLESKYLFYASIGSKCWIGIDDKNKVTCKLKGFKDKISYLDFLYLMLDDKIITKTHNKWFRSFKNSSINIKNTTFNLKTNSKKRQLVLNNNVLIGTISFKQ